MISEDKIKLMTKLAIYEKNIGKEDFEMNKYYKSNYISHKSFDINVGVTIALLIIFLFDFVMKFIENIERMTDFDFLVSLGTKYLSVWFVVIIFYSVITNRVFGKKYDKAKLRIDQYKESLNQLEETN